MIATFWYKFYAPANAIAVRGMVRMTRRSSLLMPVIIMPLFFLVAFTGSFDALGMVPDYGTDNVVDWMLPWAAIQGSAFSGVGAASITADDLEGGFYDRMLIAPVGRWVLLSGIVWYAAVRSLIPITLVMFVGYFLGATYPAGISAAGMLYVGGIGIATALTFVSLLLVYHFRTQRSLAIAQVVVFVSLFLSIGQVPLAIMEGWLKSIARINPITNIIRLSRQGMIGDVTWADTWPGLLAILGLCMVLGTMTLRNLRRLNT